MVLKTFNVDEDVYEIFSDFCKERGISMSKQIVMFMKSFIAKEPEAKKEYLEKLNKIRKNGKFRRVENFVKEFGPE